LVATFSSQGSKSGDNVLKLSPFFAAMYYVYILHSEQADRYYIGHSNDPERRLIEHNTTDQNKFTKKYRPWEMLLSFEVSELRGKAMKME
jgi:putative endonuclease